jgi:lipopolysaccharide export system protein LptC
MKQHDTFHSTAVTWLKVALPLLALAILSTLFLLARTVDPSDAIPFAEVDIEDRIREPRLTQPNWAGVTDDGAAMTITADQARPQQGDATGASANALIMDLETPDGSRTKMIAAQGMFDLPQNTFIATGGVTITTSSGYQLTTDAMTAALDRTFIISKTPVAGLSPSGPFSAGQMTITQNSDESGQYLLVFKGGVRLLYTPPSPE